MPGTSGSAAFDFGEAALRRAFCLLFPLTCAGSALRLEAGSEHCRLLGSGRAGFQSRRKPTLRPRRQALKPAYR